MSRRPTVNLGGRHSAYSGRSQTRYAIPGRPGESAADDAAPGEPTATPRPPDEAARQLWEAAKAATALRARLGRTGTCPAELAEATAALQDLACRLVPAAEAATRRAELWGLHAGLPVTVQAARNGPYLVTNVPRLVDHLGTEAAPAPQLALCRLPGRKVVTGRCSHDVF